MEVLEVSIRESDEQLFCENAQAASMEMVSMSVTNRIDSDEEPAGKETPRMGETEGKRYQRPRGKRRCAVITCTELFSGATPMQSHIWREHAGNPQSPGDFVRFLLTLADRLFGGFSSESDVMILDWLRGEVEDCLGRVGWKFSSLVRETAGTLSDELGIDRPGLVQYAAVGRGRVDHVALLVHPRLMAIGINEAIERGLWDVRQDLDCSRSDLGSEIPECEENSRSELPDVARGVEGSALAVVDCHWHPGRLPPCYRAGFDGFLALDTRPVQVPVTLIGGCAVYGMTESPQQVTDLGWVICKGIHPKEVANATKLDVGYIMEQCNKEGWAVGEVGLDYSTDGPYRHQKLILAEFFRRADQSTNIVLHLRGAEDDVLAEVPTQDCITLLDGIGVSALVPLYLHCFAGGPDQVNLWARTGRPVYFGISGSVRHFTVTQKEGICAIPRNRILVETDSPYLPNGVKFPNTPKHIGETYRCVADIIGTNIEAISEDVIRNFKTFFQKQPRNE